MKRPTEFYKGYEEEEPDFTEPREDQKETAAAIMRQKKFFAIRFTFLLSVPFALCIGSFIWIITDFFPVLPPEPHIIISFSVMSGPVISALLVNFFIHFSSQKTKAIYAKHIIPFAIFGLISTVSCFFINSKIVPLIVLPLMIVLLIISFLKYTGFEKIAYLSAMMAVTAITVSHLIYILLFVTHISFQAEYFYIGIHGKSQNAPWKTHYIQRDNPDPDKPLPDDRTDCSIIKDAAQFDNYLEELTPEINGLMKTMLADCETAYDDSFFASNDLIIYTMVYYSYPRIRTCKLDLSGKNLYIIENLYYDKYSAYTWVIYDEMCFRFLSVPKSYGLMSNTDNYDIVFMPMEICQIGEK